MTDKNRDFSQIRVGTVVVFPQTTGEVTAAKGYLVIACGQERFTFSSDTGAVINLNRVWWERTGGYIVSQPEEQSVPEQTICPDCTGAGGDNNIYVCATCNGTGGVRESEESGDIQRPTCADQASVLTREEQINDLSEALGEAMADAYADNLAQQHITEAEKRGDAAGYARRVAEEGGEAVHQVYSGLVTDKGHWMDTSADDIKKYYSDAHWKKRTLYTAPQPDTQAETIAELRLSEMHARADAEAAKAKVATLREALAALVSEFGCTLELYDRNGPSLSCADGEFIHASAIYDRREALGHAAEALAATGDE